MLSTFILENRVLIQNMEKRSRKIQSRCLLTRVIINERCHSTLWIPLMTIEFKKITKECILYAKDYFLKHLIPGFFDNNLQLFNENWLRWLIQRKWNLKDLCPSLLNKKLLSKMHAKSIIIQSMMLISFDFWIKIIPILSIFHEIKSAFLKWCLKTKEMILSII